VHNDINATSAAHITTGTSKVNVPQQKIKLKIYKLYPSEYVTLAVMFYEFRSGCRPAININYFSKFNTYEFSFFTSFSVIPAVTIVKVGGRS